MEAEKETAGKSNIETLPTWLVDPLPKNVRMQEVQKLGTWTEIRLFISSTFVDTHAERDILVKHVIPNVNRKLAERFIRVVPIDLRWGVLAEETKDCKAIQKTCLNQIDKCRRSKSETPWFIGLRTQRYGWVQEELMPSYGFENPELYSWIDKWKKIVSITSLECMHAAQVPKKLPSFPTVFFYERVLENPENIERNFKWLLDFEYITPNTDLDPEIRFQYAKTEKAATYKSDQNELNRALKNLPYAKYTKYNCHYNKGRARYTYKRENAKSFGVAYVDGLQQFQEQVEADLLTTIEMNFQKAVTDEVSRYKLENIQHEISIQDKASVFVGRKQLFETGLTYCTNNFPDSNPNVMIIHGEPGCGKSGLLSAISKECLKTLPKNENFLFTHVVDSCPGSNILEKMLKRLQLNLRQYRRNLGEVDLPLECSDSACELKEQHHNFMEESASKYPDKKFLLIIDAVNQFHESLQSWTMWWLPRQSCPKNVRFMITTLNEENSTFENARKVSHNAICVAVKEMSNEDLQEMVTATLARFNKKLTITDVPNLGNQMELLISKNKSPLYVTAACEALRKFGIYENISGYIAKLPTTVTDLFLSLLNEWSEEYGKEIVEDIAGFLYVSRDGLLENEINDLLHFKENALKGPDGILYQSSFSRLYDSLSSFLSSGGGGYLHFFHDQLKYTVRKKYLGASECQRQFHDWLSKFYYDVIQEQIMVKPSKESSVYYEHALQQIVYHQLESTSPNKSLSILSVTLRNIYFVRERVIHDQVHDLNQEYMDAIEKSNSEKEILALKEWARFVQLYASAILEFPEFCYNMAINQIKTSIVRVDTEGLPAPECKSGYPLIWSNNPNIEDPMAVKYLYSSRYAVTADCVASTPEGDICCAVDSEKALIFDLSSGELLHELEIEGYSLALSPNFATLWIGDFYGFVSLWDVNTGTLILKLEDHLDGCIVWLELIGDMLACGTSNELGWDGHPNSHIALFSIKGKCISNKWSTESPGFCFCYHKTQKLIFSGHKGFIKCWNLAGDLQFTLYDAGDRVNSLCSHPAKDIILSGSEDSKIRQWSITNKEICYSFRAGTGCVQYDAAGERILCSYNLQCSNSLRIYSLIGVLLDEFKGHRSYINKISLVPGSNQVLTAGMSRQIILWNLPPLDKQKVKEHQEIIKHCEFMPGGDQYVTLSGYFLRIWDTNTHTVSSYVKLGNEKDYWHISGAVHSSGEYICIGKKMDVYYYRVPDLAMYHSFRALDESSIGDSVKGNQRAIECSIHKIKISPDGSKLLVLDKTLLDLYMENKEREKSHAIVFDITEIKKTKQHVVYREHNEAIEDCDIHSDSIQAVTCGYHTTVVWSVVTGETFHRLDKVKVFSVKFFTQTQRIMCSISQFGTGIFKLQICDLNDDSNIITLDSSEDLSAKYACLYDNESLIVTASKDGAVRMFDTTSGKCVYGFFQSHAQGYTSLAIHPSKKLILAANKNGNLYALKPEQYYKAD